VVATDGDIKSMELLRRNVARNPGDVKCEQLLWGDSEKIKALGRFDVVIGCDIVALPYTEAFNDLVDTFLGLCHPATSPKKVALDRAQVDDDVASSKQGMESSGERGTHVDESNTNSSVVYLAYKARHCTEEPFFDLAENRGFKRHNFPREESIHPDFLDDTSLSIMKLTL
jgi:hypothetical protein